MTSASWINQLGKNYNINDEHEAAHPTYEVCMKDKIRRVWEPTRAKKLLELIHLEVIVKINHVSQE